MCPHLRGDIGPAQYSVASSGGIRMNQDWRESLEWMNASTPDTGVDYYTIYDRDTFSYPATAYGVMSWWDYGHMITYIAQPDPELKPVPGRSVRSERFGSILHVPVGRDHQPDRRQPGNPLRHNRYRDGDREVLGDGHLVQFNRGNRYRTSRLFIYPILITPVPTNHSRSTQTNTS